MEVKLLMCFNISGKNPADHESLIKNTFECLLIAGPYTSLQFIQMKECVCYSYRIFI